MPGVDLRSRERGEAGDVEEILDGKGHAGEGAGVPARGERRVHGFGVAKALSVRTAVKQLSDGSRRADSLEARAVTSRAVTRRARMSAAMPRASIGVTLEDRGRLRVTTGKSPRSTPAGKESGEIPRHAFPAFRRYAQAYERGCLVDHTATSDPWSVGRGDASGSRFMPGDRPPRARRRRSAGPAFPARIARYRRDSARRSGRHWGRDRWGSALARTSGYAVRRPRGPGSGTQERRARVYGRPRPLEDFVDGTHLHDATKYITSTRSASSRTTLRSWETKR